MSDQAPFQFTCGPTTGCGKAFDVVRSGNGWTLPEVCPRCGQPQHGAGKIFFTSSEPMSRTAQAIAALIGGAGEKGIPKERLAPLLYMLDVHAREYLGHPITDIDWTAEKLDVAAAEYQEPHPDAGLLNAIYTWSTPQGEQKLTGRALLQAVAQHQWLAETRPEGGQHPSTPRVLSEPAELR
jgi:hypothetical protein